MHAIPSSCACCIAEISVTVCLTKSIKNKIKKENNRKPFHQKEILS